VNVKHVPLKAGVLTMVCKHCKAKTFRVLMSNHFGVLFGESVTDITFIAEAYECIDCGEQYAVQR
jgi:hypothetical protein